MFGVAHRPLWMLCAIAAVAALVGATYADASADPLATPPGPYPTGALGGSGPCGRSERIITSGTTLLGEPLSVYIETPTGAASTPLLGGTCNAARRPVIFFSHGFGVGTPSAYASLIEHWVSIGNIVVMADYDAAQTDLEVSFTQVDAGNAAAVAVEPRIDTSRSGFFGYSHGGGMTPYLAQRASSRGWGRNGTWLISLSQAYTQFQGIGGPIALPSNARVLVVAGDNDQYADARNGNDVFRSVTAPASRKDHITLNSDRHGLPWLDASHAIVTDSSAPAGVDALDYAVWRLSDILETCSLRNKNCGANLSAMGAWSDGTPVRPATVSDSPVDIGPIPAILAECDGTVFALLMNPRIGQCGPSSF